MGESNDVDLLRMLARPEVEGVIATGRTASESYVLHGYHTLLIPGYSCKIVVIDLTTSRHNLEYWIAAVRTAKGIYGNVMQSPEAN